MLLCDIKNFKQVCPINRTEEKYFSSSVGININKLIQQHENFVNLLVKHDVSFKIVESDANLPEQVFIRDVAFKIGDTWCVSNMASEIRKEEPQKVIKYLQKHSLNIYMMENHIEGGDVFVHNENIFVGVGNRTSVKVIDELKSKFPNYNIIPITLKDDVLHLDCVLGVINNIYAFVYKDGVSKESYNLLCEFFNLIEITKLEQENLATNFLKVGNVVICEKNNHRVNKIINKLGYFIEEIEFDEIHKLGGSFHCCSLEVSNKQSEHKKYLSYKENTLYYNDINLKELVNKFGAPLNICYLDDIQYRIRTLKTYFNRSIKDVGYEGSYNYAFSTKANYNYEIMYEGIKYADSVEVSSYADLYIVENILSKLKMHYKKIVCNGNKDDDYINLIVKLHNENYNIENVVDSLREYEILNRNNYNKKMTIGFRINVKNIYRKSEDHALSDRFGLSDVDIEYINNNFNKEKFILKTIHFHQRSSLYDEEKAIENLKFVFENYYVKMSKLYDTIDTYNIGGGCPYDKIHDYEYKSYADLIVKTLKLLSDKYNIKAPNIVQENGRYTVSDAAFDIFKVTDVKVNNGNTWYIINDSIIRSLPNSWALKENFLFLPLDDTGELITVCLAGNTCDCDDVYYFQNKDNFVYMPKKSNDSDIYIACFGIGAYQEILSGLNGVHHCLNREKCKIIIKTKKNKLTIKIKKRRQQAKDILSKIK